MANTNKRLIVRLGETITDWSDYWRLGLSRVSSGRSASEFEVWVQVEPSWEQHRVISAPSQAEAVRVLDYIQDGLENGVSMIDLRSFERSWDDKGFWEPKKVDTSITAEQGEALGYVPLVSTMRQTPQDLPSQGGESEPTRKSGRTKHRI